MSLFRRVLAPLLKSVPLSLRDPSHWRNAEAQAYTGESASAQNVLTLSAAWACVNLLAGTVGTLPVYPYRKAKNGAQEIAESHPLYRVLHDSPNTDQTAVDFLEFMEAALDLWGNSYSERIYGSQGQLVSLVPIRPDAMHVDRATNGRLRYRWTENGRQQERDQSQILHVRGFGGGPEGGLSTLAYGRHTFGLGIAINKASGSTFANGLRPSGALTFDKFLSPSQREIAETSLVNKFAGAANAGRPMILEGGLKWQALTINPEDAQMLESRGFSVEEVCRMFGVPPFMIGHTEKSTSWGSGLEQQTLGFVKFTLRRRLKRIEQAMERQLLTPRDRAEGISVKFSLEGLLRGDSAGRSKFYKSALADGWMTINEVRALENLPPVVGGDVPRIQMQNVSLSEADAANGVSPPEGT